MPVHKFKLADRMEFVGSSHGRGPLGMKGKVIALDGGIGKPVGVEFDKPVEKGHSCDGKGKPGLCRWALDEELKATT